MAILLLRQRSSSLTPSASEVNSSLALRVSVRIFRAEVILGKSGSRLAAFGCLLALGLCWIGTIGSPNASAAQLQPGVPGTLTPEQKNVQDAIDRGVAWLKTHTESSTYGIGESALAGLTLLECGEALYDPRIEKILARVRQESPQATQTYHIALMILFLDRLGRSQDRELIRSLALRLIASQTNHGGWDYGCWMLSREQETNLLGMLQQKMQVAPDLPKNDTPKGEQARSTPAPTKGDAAPKQPTPPAMRGRQKGQPRRIIAGSDANLPNNVADLPVLRYEPGQNFIVSNSRRDDNSLTQFAILALWVARRYDVPVDRCLAMVEARFRTSQFAEGCWGYEVNSRSRLDSMTCAGLIGLAVGRALDNTPGANQADPVRDKALRFVGKVLNGRGNQANSEGGTLIRADSWGDLYFLWTLERMAVVHDLKLIEGKDWYAWGSRLIVKAQQSDGSWRDAFPGIPDTCFALLFLKRVNVVPDLTEKLKDTQLPVNPQNKVIKMAPDK